MLTEDGGFRSGTTTWSGFCAFVYDLIKGQINGISTGLNPVRLKWISPWSLRPSYGSKQSSSGLVLAIWMCRQLELQWHPLTGWCSIARQRKFSSCLEKKNLNNDVNMEGKVLCWISVRCRTLFVSNDWEMTNCHKDPAERNSSMKYRTYLKVRESRFLRPRVNLYKASNA